MSPHGRYAYVSLHPAAVRAQAYGIAEEAGHGDAEAPTGKRHTMHLGIVVAFRPIRVPPPTPQRDVLGRRGRHCTAPLLLGALTAIVAPSVVTRTLHVRHAGAQPLAGSAQVWNG